MSEDKYISNPRPTFSEDPEKELPGKKVIVLGSPTSGIILRISRKGLEFNGYYAGMTDAIKFANLRGYSMMTWEDLDKLKRAAFKPKKKETTAREPDKIEEKVDKKYLASLPITTLNGNQYYIDADKHVIRPVKNPENVYDFKGNATKKPS